MNGKGILKLVYTIICAKCLHKETGESSSMVMAKRVLSLKGWRDIIGIGWICPECGKLHQEPPTLLV